MRRMRATAELTHRVIYCLSRTASAASIRRYLKYEITSSQRRVVVDLRCEANLQKCTACSSQM